MPFLLPTTMENGRPARRGAVIAVRYIFGDLGRTASVGGLIHHASGWSRPRAMMWIGPACHDDGRDISVLGFSRANRKTRAHVLFLFQLVIVNLMLFTRPIVG